MKRAICLLLALWMLLGSFAMAEETVLDLRGKRFSSVEDVCKVIDAADAVDVVDLTNVILPVSMRKQLVQLYPDIHFRWTLDVYGVLVTSEDTTLNMARKHVSDHQKIIDCLDIMPNLERVLMYNNYLTQEERERMYYGYPDVFFGWSFSWGNGRFSVRTDATAYSTLKEANDRTPVGTSWVQFCPDLKALDLGHNTISDLSFLEKAPKLKLLILADNQIKDISPIACQTELEYLELFVNDISDISALANLTQLKDLNLCYNEITDLSPLYDLPNLERLWLTENNGITQEQKDAFREHQPDVEVVYSSLGSTGVVYDENGREIPGTGWRRHERFRIVWTIFNKGNYLPWDAEIEWEE